MKSPKPIKYAECFGGVMKKKNKNVEYVFSFFTLYISVIRKLLNSWFCFADRLKSQSKEGMGLFIQSAAWLNLLVAYVIISAHFFYPQHIGNLYNLLK